jgi:hypothetical protein
MKIEQLVENAVKLTDSAVFPPARLLRKLDTLPPGHAATKNIPKATEGGGCINRTRHQVKNGSRINWENRPKKKDFGFLARYAKSRKQRSNATPYMISASARLSKSKSLEEKLSRIASRSFLEFIRITNLIQEI